MGAPLPNATSTGTTGKFNVEGSVSGSESFLGSGVSAETKQASKCLANATRRRGTLELGYRKSSRRSGAVISSS